MSTKSVYVFAFVMAILATSGTKMCIAQSVFDLKRRAVTLNNGQTMPVLGLGTWALSDEEAERCAYAALKAGYRLIDTALYYNTHRGVGRAVRKAVREGVCSRKDVFITTKIAPYMSGSFEELIRRCNDELGLGYIDLLLVHQQGSREKELYAAIEDAVKRGVVRGIGISNYYTPSDYERMAKGALILPTVIQNENHPFYHNSELQKYVAKDGVLIESYYPLGGRGHTDKLLGNPVIVRVASRHGKSPAQTILRWHLQSGYIAVPGSSNPAHIAENIDIFDFQLTDADMAEIASLDTGRRYENW